MKLFLILICAILGTKTFAATSNIPSLGGGGGSGVSAYLKVAYFCNSNPCTKAQSSSNVGTVNWNSSGNYTINFSPAFTNIPMCTITAITNSSGNFILATIYSESTSAISFTLSAGVSSANQGFNVICTGT